MAQRCLDGTRDLAYDRYFDGPAQQSVVFRLLGALSRYGKLGTACIGDSHESALKYYRDTVAVLDREARR